MPQSKRVFNRGKGLFLAAVVFVVVLVSSGVMPFLIFAGLFWGAITYFIYRRPISAFTWGASLVSLVIIFGPFGWIVSTAKDQPAYYWLIVLWIPLAILYFKLFESIQSKLMNASEKEDERIKAEEFYIQE